MQEEKNTIDNWKFTLTTLAVIFTLFFLYTIARYVVFKGLPPTQIPFYLMNKTIAITTVAMLGISLGLGPLNKILNGKYESIVGAKKYFGLVGFGLAAIHTIMSLALLKPSYYGKFFEGDRLNFTGETSLLFGTLALFLFSVLAIVSIPSVSEKLDKKAWDNISRIGFLGFGLVMLHVFVMGYSGWLDTSRWPGKMLPISLIAFLMILIVFIVKLFSSLKPAQKED